MLLLHRRWTIVAPASPRLWWPSLSTATAFSSSWYSSTTSPAIRKKNDRDFARLVPAVEAFHASAGHWIVPYHFPIPSPTGEEKKFVRTVRVVGLVEDMIEIDWPQAAAGMNVGRVLNKFMNNPVYKDEYPKVVTELREIGFPVDDDWRETVWKQKKIAALRTFYEIHDHTHVRIDYVVPRAEPWPVCTWGFGLGKMVDFLRQHYKSLNDDEVTDLESVKFPVNAIDFEWSEMILPALEAYAQVHGHCHVEKNFKVPSEAPWPKIAWGLKLGIAVSSMRLVGTYSAQATRDAEHLDAIGFIWSSMATHRWEEYVMPALEAFARINGSCKYIPMKYVIPSETPWPEKLWGFQLGSLANNIRYKGYYAHQITRDQQRLKEIGFRWK